MEDLLKFLLVAATVVIAIVKHVQDNAKKKEAQKPPSPTARPVPPFSAPEEADETYGGYIPAGPAPEPEAPVRPKPVARPEGRRTTPQKPLQTAPAPGALPETDDADYQLRSPEDVRRAIVWSEILNRKY